GVTMSIAGAWYMDDTYDERYHWSWSAQLLNTSDSSRTAVANYRSTTPIILLNVATAQVLNAKGLSPKNVWFLRRLPTVLWLVALYAFVFRLGRRMGGPLAGSVALLLCALDANLMTHASLVTVDCAFAFAILLFCASAYQYVVKPNPLSACRLGFALALGAITKFSALLLFPCLIALLVTFDKTHRIRQAHFVQGLVVLPIALLFINAAYFFIGTFTELSQLTLYSSSFKSLAMHYPTLRLPLPADFITGVDQCLSTDQGTTWAIAFLDHYYTSGIWYFFIVLWFLKTPVMTISVSLLGLYRGIATKCFFILGQARFTLAIFLIFLGYFSLLFRTMVGFRYALMCLPLLYLLAGVGFAQKFKRHNLKLLSLCFLVGICELGFYWGNPLSFTNLAVQPKKSVYRLMSDSNIQWGQNHSQVSKIQSQLGIPIRNVMPPHILPGTNLLDVNNVAGIWYNRARYAWLRDNLEPSRHINHTHLLYEISPATFEAYMREERTLLPTNTALHACRFVNKGKRLDNPSQVYDIDIKTPFLCVMALTKSRFYFTSLRSGTVMGVRKADNSCHTIPIDPRKTSWFDSESGPREFCIPGETPGGPLRITLVSGSIELFQD
ncbi:MAG: glycosyltransferase family 39 protein, partial [Bdellovibrionales bacterium]|nr:glycosyltransferase family 39 protein [Bdellovibrionales bacterium]